MENMTTFHENTVSNLETMHSFFDNSDKCCPTKGGQIDRQVRWENMHS